MKQTLFLALITLSIALHGAKIKTDNNTLLYKTKDFKVFKTKAVYKGKDIYNSKKDLQETIKKLKKYEEKVCENQFNSAYTPLSLVDGYFSYELYTTNMGCEDQKSSSSFIVKTINLNTKKQVELTELFTEKSIISAIKNDKWVIKNLTPKDINSINSFKSFMKLMSKFTGDAKLNSDGFAILSYDKNKNEASVRLIGEQKITGMNYEPLQLGLILTPKKSFEKQLKDKIRFVFGKFDSVTPKLTK